MSTGKRYGIYQWNTNLEAFTDKGYAKGKCMYGRDVHKIASGKSRVQN
jgi:hypothetical protein